MYSLSIWDYSNNKLIDLRTANISILGQAYGGQFRKNINGLKELDFVLPLYIVNDDGLQEENFRWDYIRLEQLIKLEYNNTYDWFIIKTFEDVRDDGGKLLSNIQCKHISNLLTQSGIDLHIDQTGNATELLTLILKGSGWTVGTVDVFRNKDDEIKIRTLKVERSNRYNAIQELAELFGGYPIFNPDKTIDFKIEVGQNNGVVFRYGKNLKSVKRTIGNNGEVITKLWVEGGTDDVGVVTISDVNPTGENYILNFDYFIDGGFLTQEQVDAIDNYQNSVKPVNDNIALSLSNISSAFSSITIKRSNLEAKKLSRASKQQLKDEIALKIQSETDTNIKNSLITQRDQLQSEINTLNTDINSLQGEITGLETDIQGYEQNLTNSRNDKSSLLSLLNASVSSFIREGLWQDSKYVDSQSLFDDALEQSEKYAYPQVLYEMSILDLSKLTGYEIEKFDLGDIIRIIDEKLHIDTLGRITEFTLDLEKPYNISVQIGNFYSNFEDLFRRISESAEIIKQRQEVYERAVGINPDGTVNYDVLQKTFDNNKFIVTTGTNNSVVQDENGLTIKDVDNPLKMLRLNYGGAFLTNDGGETWKVGMSPEGLSALNITSGVIDTKLLQIWNSEEPRFKWDEDGIYAFADNSVDKYIKFNQDGIFYTLNGGLTYLAKWTWNEISFGLDQGRRFIVHPDGSVEMPKLTYNEVSTDFGNSIDISANNSIVMRVENDKVIQAINLSPEGLLIDVDKVQFLGDVIMEQVEIKDLLVKKADIIDLTAETARINTLYGNYAEIDSILSQSVFSELAEFGEIRAGSAIIADEAIGSAQISDLDVAKLNAGTISTAKFTVVGSDGRLKIQDNLLQVFDGDTNLFERIALGDVNNDGSIYGLRIRGADGTTILFNEDGQTKEGFTDGYNKLDANSLEPDKINIERVVSRINDSTETFKASKVLIDNETLDVKFSTIVTDLSNQGQEISNHSTQITALDGKIALKLDSQDFTTYTDIIDNDLQTITTNLSKATTDITALQGQISLKVEQTDIDTAKTTIRDEITQAVDGIEVGGRNLLLSSNTAELSEIETGNDDSDIEVLGDEWGRNLLRNSGNFSNTEGWPNNPTIVVKDRVRVLELSGGMTNNFGANIKLDPKMTYIYRGIIAFDKDINGQDIRADVPLHCHTRYDGSNSAGRKSIKLLSSHEGLIPAGTWISIVIELETRDDDELGDIIFSPYVYGPAFTDVTYWIKNIKLEKGSIATDWTPAPEDLTHGYNYNLSQPLQPDTWYTLSTDYTGAWQGLWIDDEYVGYFNEGKITFRSPAVISKDSNITIKVVDDEIPIEWAKLEKGNKATDWTPAPEDVDEAISTVDTKIDTKVAELNVDISGISARVGSTESSLGDKANKASLIAEINLSPEEIQLNANRIKIGMGTTFEQGQIYTWNQYLGKTWNQMNS